MNAFSPTTQTISIERNASNSSNRNENDIEIRATSSVGIEVLHNNPSTTPPDTTTLSSEEQYNQSRWNQRRVIASAILFITAISVGVAIAVAFSLRGKSVEEINEAAAETSEEDALHNNTSLELIDVLDNYKLHECNSKDGNDTRVEICMAANCVSDPSCSCQMYLRITESNSIIGTCDSCSVCRDSNNFAFDCSNLNSSVQDCPAAESSDEKVDVSSSTPFAEADFDVYSPPDTYSVRFCEKTVDSSVELCFAGECTDDENCPCDLFAIDASKNIIGVCDTCGVCAGGDLSFDCSNVGLASRNCHVDETEIISTTMNQTVEETDNYELNGTDYIYVQSSVTESDLLNDKYGSSTWNPTIYPTFQPTLELWNHGTSAVSTHHSGTITFQIPDETVVGDTLFLFLSRTDDVLPLELSGWNRVAECFKSYNSQSECFTAWHCIERDGPYCRDFDNGDDSGSGKDLATVCFYCYVEDGDPWEWTFDIDGWTSTWAIVVAVPGVNQDQPIFSVVGTSCDGEYESVFPSLYGEKGNVVLYSQSFDDAADLSRFRPPIGTELMGWTHDEDDAAGFVYGKKLEETGWAGEQWTQGKGGYACKDVLISVIVNID